VRGGRGTVRAGLRAAALLGAALVAAACEGDQRILDARGPAAQQIATLWWLMLAFAVLTSVLFSLALLVAVMRSRRRAAGAEVPEVSGRVLVWAGGVAFPAVLLFVTLIYSYLLSRDVYPPRAFEGEPLTIEVVGHMFWWEVRYPELGVVTANEFHIPAGQHVRFRVSAADVIHSFWIPQLQGKIDMIPGRTHEWWVHADSTGVFRGQCAEYCGIGHALMALWVTAAAPADFDGWLEARRTPAPLVLGPLAERGRAVFTRSGCAHCHIAPGQTGPAELATVAPTLSDFAERRTIAAGTLTNTPDNLAAWIAEPHRVKLGSRMPPTSLPAEDLQALIAYLHARP